MNEFGELYQPLDEPDALPEWMTDLREQCHDLCESMQFWFNEKGGMEIERAILEFQQSSHGYIKAGVLAQHIKYLKMYRDVSSCFSEFCKKFLGKTVWMVNRTIAASELAIKLMQYGFTEIPANESQCRPLLKLDPDDLIETWRIVCESIPQPDRTAKAINAVVIRLFEADPDFLGKPTTQKIELSPELWVKLQEKAERYGMSPDKYLELLLDKDLADAPEPEPEPNTPSKKKPKSKRQTWRKPESSNAVITASDGTSWVVEAPT